jgi:hypothetical protein
MPPAPLVGELLTADASARTFAIKTAAEGEVKFSYDDGSWSVARRPPIGEVPSAIEPP